MLEYPLFFWGNILGCGQKKNPQKQDPYFWIEDFPLPRKTSLWNDFSTKTILFPKYLYKIPPQQSSSLVLHPKSCQNTPTKNQWSSLIKLWKKEKNEKIVLARKKTWVFTENINAIELFFFLQKQAKNSLAFGIFLDEHTAFLGCTPEKLFFRKGDLLLTEALAATAKPQDRQDLFSSKNQKEFLFVKNSIKDCLKKLCKSFNYTNDIYIKETNHICHLHYPFSGILNSQVSNEKIIKTLHPTPAMGGVPRTKALSFISQHESFDRGYYMGNFGFSFAKYTYANIAIRSCLIKKNIMHQFTGAGILLSSVPSKEWEELNSKEKIFPCEKKRNK